MNSEYFKELKECFFNRLDEKQKEVYKIAYDLGFREGTNQAIQKSANTLKRVLEDL